MANNTIIRPPTPRYGIHEVVYFRESAMLGYLEPAKVYGITYDPKLNKTFYTFVYKKRPPNNQIAGDAIDLKSAKSISVVEEELLTYAEALAIKKTYLTAELEKTDAQIARDVGLPVIDVASAATDPFDFGSVTTGSFELRTYTITNTGGGLLVMNNSPVVMVGDSDFSVETQPDEEIAVGGSSDFVIRFAPTSAERKVGVVQIANNDPTSNTLSFVVEGLGA